MCGIAGIIDWQNRPYQRLVTGMVAQLRHRGPDAQHVKSLDSATLGHARLSVIDPSPVSDQPMCDESGRFWIVFNGEIYNFAVLRQELEAYGAHFRTRSDTEVVLEAYKRWGSDCVSHFNGMFAIALWDRAERRLFLARDRFGKKPLFYSLLPDGLIFASSPTALTMHPGVSRRLNPAAMRQMVSLSYILGSDCIFEGMRKLEPGHRLILDQNKAPLIERYWDLAPAFRAKSRWSSEAEAEEALQELMTDAVRMRMVSDVPLGAFLSGGIDSALIVAMMAGQGGEKIKTFSAGFAHASFNEAPQARRISAFVGTDHHDCMIEDDSVGDLRVLMDCVGEPFADTSLLPTYRLSGFARKNVTVCLTGDGGDELFAGYETYVADRLHSVLRYLPGPLVSLAGNMLDRFWPASFGKVSLDYKLRQFLAGLRLDFPQAHYSWRTLYAGDELETLFRPERWSEVSQADPFARFQQFYSRVEGCHWLDQASYVDVGTWLVDDVLVKVDRATMAHGLEARSPFLDHRVAEFSAALPVEMKLRRLQTKHILKRLHSSYYPENLRPGPKRGFNAPIAYWFSGPQRSAAKRLTESPQLQEWLDPAKVADLWAQHDTRRRDNSFRLFSLACLGAWLENWTQYTAAAAPESNLV